MSSSILNRLKTKHVQTQQKRFLIIQHTADWTPVMNLQGVDLMTEMTKVAF